MIKLEIGSLHKEIEKNIYEWTFFVRPSNLRAIRRVDAYLVKQNGLEHIILLDPPFEVTKSSSVTCDQMKIRVTLLGNKVDYFKHTFKFSEEMCSKIYHVFVPQLHRELMKKDIFEEHFIKKPESPVKDDTTLTKSAKSQQRISSWSGWIRKLGVFDPYAYEIRSNEMDLMDFKVNYDSETDLFIDHGFPANSESLYDPESGRKIPEGIHKVSQWLRPDKIANNPQLFVEGSLCGDVYPGALGDCWFINGLCIMGTQPKYVRQLFVSIPKYPEKLGKYEIRFFNLGIWQTVVIDDQLPCSTHNQLAFAKCKNENEFWIPLLQKAFAKLNGTYQELEDGCVADALVALTGGVTKQIKIKKDDKSIWDVLNEYASSKCHFIGCSADPVYPKDKGKEMGASGLRVGYCYVLLECKTVKSHKLVRLRNPWANSDWRGRWSDGSREWTHEVKHLMQGKHKIPGQFWMCITDFITYFTTIDIVRIFNDPAAFEPKWYYQMRKGEWIDESAGGIFSYDYRSKFNPQYLFYLPTDSNVVISLMQLKHRFEKENKTKNYRIGIHVLKYDGPSPGDPQRAERIFYDHQKVVAVTPSWDESREVIIEQRLLSGAYMIVPSTYDPGFESPFLLRVYAHDRPTLTVMPSLNEDYCSDEVESEWNTLTAGGSMKYWSYIKNDQFVLRINSDAIVHICLRQHRSSMYYPIGFYVFQSEGTRRLYSGKPLKEVKQFKDVNEVCASFSLESGVNYIVMPCTLNPNCISKYTLSAFTKAIMGQEISLSMVEDGYTTQLEGEWITKKAGGSPEFETWKYNPRFLLYIEQECNIRLVLVQKLDFQLFQIGINVLSETGEMLLGSSSWKQSRVVELIDSLQSGKYYVVPSTRYPQEYAPFSIICHSSRPHRFKKK